MRHFCLKLYKTRCTPVNEIQARKRHININFLVRLPLGRPPVCPRDNPGLSLGQTRVFSLFYTVEARFVPGTNPVCPWDKPRRETEKVYVLNVYVPFSLARDRLLKTSRHGQHRQHPERDRNEIRIYII